MISYLSFPTRRCIRGAALIVTLSLLVLVAALVLTVFLSVTNERAESSAAANQSDAQRLANSVVSVVKSTITQATSGYETNASTGAFNTSTPTAWASQPGLIRTWLLNGTPSASFRLYSSGTIVVSGSLDVATEESEVEQWKTTSKSTVNSYDALWCDLNAPALNEAGQRIYPIITPPKDTNSGSSVTDGSCGISTDDPDTTAQEGVQGFSVTGAPGFLSGTEPSATNNPVPMPVKWLYVLQDGSFVTPSGSGSSVTVSGAKKSNPIVARVAYWTDDETCKVNVNTASEYYYWEPPVTYTNVDVNIRARYQPGSNEYQRYPGHPATTCLSTIFDKLGIASDSETTAERALRYQKLTNLTPRISYTSDGKPYDGSNAAGSEAGTAICYMNSTSTEISSGTSRITMDCDRLYATAEDLLYDPSRAEQLVSQDILDAPGDLQQRLCFLTARNTSPDVNWMNRPRISLWPLNPDETAKWSAYDKLLAFCGTLNSSLYYFQRTDGFDPSVDINLSRNQEIYNYLLNMLNQPIPGAGGLTYASKSSRDPKQLLINIFDFIRCHINLRYAGGYTGAGTGALDDPSTSYFFPPGQAYNYFGSFAPAPTVFTTSGTTIRGPGSYPVVTDVLLHFWAAKPGETSPASVTQDYPSTAPTSGTSIQRTVQMNLLLNLCNPLYDNGKYACPQYQIRVSGDGWSITNGADPAVDATVVGGRATMNFPTSAGNVLRVYATHYNQMDLNMCGGYYNIGWLYRGANSADQFAQSASVNTFKSRTFSRTPAANTFTFYSDPINFNIPIGSSLAGTNGTISRTSWLEESKNPATAYFNGGTIKIEFFPGVMTGGTTEADSYDVSSTDPVQTITVNVPSCTIPVPLLGSNNLTGTNTSEVIGGAASSLCTYYELGSWANRAHYYRPETFVQTLKYSSGNATDGSTDAVGNTWNMDVVRGITLDPSSDHKGDLRVVENALTIPASWYTAEYSGAEKSFCISTYRNDTTAGSALYKLDSTATYASYTNRIAAPTLNGMQRNGVPNVGDFITGWGIAPMGGYFPMNDVGYVWNNASGTALPYYVSTETSSSRSVYNALTYSPARMVASPLILGAVSAYASETKTNAWETLLFCRDPLGGTDSHNGWTQPRDHYLLDLFKMPVVEPYAISQPLSTDGRVNLNCGIVPFSYINRTTGLYAAMKGTCFYAISNANGTKCNGTSNSPSSVWSQDYVVALDVNRTIAQVQDRAPYITPSEFTEVFLIPEGQTASSVESFWKAQKGDGKNLREAPYNHIYPKLTTKSNTYTVHMRVQTLKQVKGRRSSDADWEKWDETKDAVVSEYRGSSTIERYIDPNDTSIPDFAQSANYNKNVAPYYRWRTIADRRFMP